MVRESVEHVVNAIGAQIVQVGPKKKSNVVQLPVKRKPTAAKKPAAKKKETRQK